MSVKPAAHSIASILAAEVPRLQRTPEFVAKYDLTHLGETAVDSLLQNCRNNEKLFVAQLHLVQLWHRRDNNLLGPDEDLVKLSGIYTDKIARIEDEIDPGSLFYSSLPDAA